METNRAGSQRKVSHCRKRIVLSSPTPEIKKKSFRTSSSDYSHQRSSSSEESNRCKWFENSFCSDSSMASGIKSTDVELQQKNLSEMQDEQKLGTRQQGNLIHKKAYITSTPNNIVSNEKTKDNMEDELNNSDSLLTEIDISSIETCVNNAFDHPTSLSSCDRSTPQTPKMQNVSKVMRNEVYDQNEISCECLLNIGNGSSTQKSDIPSTPKSSISSDISTPSSTSLANNIKRRLRENAALKSPEMKYSEYLRKKMLRKAQLEVKTVDENSVIDIGPFYGLPSKVKELYESLRGIKKLYEWQDECLRLPAVLEGRNFIYSLPTSGGKTLVAEILILRELLLKKKNCLLILPFISIVQEKVRNLSQFAIELDFLVEEYAGSKGRYPPVKRRKSQSLYIATMEKAHSLVNCMIEKKTLENVGLIVVDELHMLGEGGSRGSVLEATLLKVMSQSKNTQIIGMSATFSNIEDLQNFLKAEIYFNDFRPVKLTEFIKIEDNIYRVDREKLCLEDKLQHERVIKPDGYSSEMSKLDPDHLFSLVLEVIPNKSCLLFCPTKKNCESVAQLLCRMMVRYKRELLEIKKLERKALLEALYNDGCGNICPILQYCIDFGIAYHHSGLTADERRRIEEAYCQGTLYLLTCTSTLAAGVNLPAKRVILRSPYVGIEFICNSQYKQMIGRAGRAGLDTSGESILIAKREDMKQMEGLIGGQVEKCLSSLMFNEGQGISNIILSTIGLNITPTIDAVNELIGSSLLAVQSKERDIDISSVTSQGLEYLREHKLIKSTNESDLIITPLGRAIYKGSVNISYGPQLYTDLQKAKEGLILANYLHLLYLVTPYEMVEDFSPSWSVYVHEILHLDPAELKMANQIGVSENYIVSKASCQVVRQKVDENVVKRFYLTLMLYLLWKHKTVWEVAERFEIDRGFIQRLLSSASSFASCVFHFCQELEEFWAFVKLLEHFIKQLSYCVSKELVPLMEITGVKMCMVDLQRVPSLHFYVQNESSKLSLAQALVIGLRVNLPPGQLTTDNFSGSSWHSFWSEMTQVFGGRARQLYDAGFRSLAHVANAVPEQLVKSIEHMPRRAANQIVASAKLLLNEKAEELLQEMEELVNVSDDMFSKEPQDLEIQEYSQNSFNSKKSTPDTLT